jgi:hypothetical protein
MKYLGPPQSGSIADTVFSRNRYGQYTRQRVVPVNTITPRRTAIRSIVATASQSWQTLTQSKMQGWSAWAEAQFAAGKLGERTPLSGFAAYMRVNINLLNTGGAMNSVPPVNIQVHSVKNLTLTAIKSGPTLVAVWQLATASAGNVIISYSPPLSSGRNFNATWWQSAVVALNALNSSNGTAYAAEFGTWAIGKRIYVKITPVSTSGIAGPPIITSTISS